MEVFSLLMSDNAGALRRAVPLGQVYAPLFTHTL